MIGRTLSHYKILGKIGRGGMGIRPMGLQDLVVGELGANFEGHQTENLAVLRASYN